MNTLTSADSRPRLPTRTESAELRPDRRMAILLAAEKLFARHGYHAVSVRQIADEAGVQVALLGYYFGPKNALFEAIFEHWSPSIEARLAALAEVPINPEDTRTLPRIIEAFTAPVLALRASNEGEYYAQLVARELSHSTDESESVLRRYFDPMAHAFIDALHRALPHATRGQIAWGYQFALGALLHHLKDTRVERLSGGENTPADPAAGALLVNFIVGGLRTAFPRPRTGRTTSPKQSGASRKASS